MDAPGDKHEFLPGTQRSKYTLFISIFLHFKCPSHEPLQPTQFGSVKCTLQSPIFPPQKNFPSYPRKGLMNYSNPIVKNQVY